MSQNNDQNYQDQPTRRARRPAPGLSQGAYSAAPPTYRVHFRGTERVDVRPEDCRCSKPVGGPRGKCSGFSKAAARRLRDHLWSLDPQAWSVAWAITLTYPARFPTERSVLQGHLDAFWQRLKRAYPEHRLAFVWKLEWQQRGAPHFHLLLFARRRLSRVSALGPMWADVVKSGDAAHAQAGVSVRPMCNKRCSIRRQISYISKPVAPHEGEGARQCGRCWGKKGDWRDYLAPVHEKRLSGAQVVRLVRVLEAVRLARARARRQDKPKAIVRARRRRHAPLLCSRRWYANARAIASRLAEIVGPQ